MVPSAPGPQLSPDAPAPSRQPWARAATWIAQAAAMAAVVTVGVAALSFFPHPRPAPAPIRIAARTQAVAPAPLAAPVAPLLRPRISPPPAHPHLALSVQRPKAPPASHAAAVASAHRGPAPCPRASLAADRLVCSEPALASLDRRMRAAYVRAIAAGADRLEIDRGQARWHGARDRTTEPGQLERLYLRRIADLEAAAARPPGRRAPNGGQA